MFTQNTSQQYPAEQSAYPLSDATMRLLERRAEETRLMHRWICGNCGTAHGRILPEECKSCGATALEFQYTLLAGEPRA